MTELPEYDEAAALERSVREIRQDWNGLREVSSSGQKARLTQMKNHYFRIIQADPKAAAELLALYEYRSDLIRDMGRLTLKKEKAT